MILDWTVDHQEREKKMNRHKNHSLVTFTAIWYSIMVKYQSKSVVERMEVIFIVFSLLQMFKAIFWKMAIFPTASTAPYFFVS